MLEVMRRREGNLGSGGGEGVGTERKDQETRVATRGATEEGLTSRGGRHLRLPLRFGLRWRIPGTGEPGGLLAMGSHRVGHN